MKSWPFVWVIIAGGAVGGVISVLLSGQPLWQAIAVPFLGLPIAYFWLRRNLAALGLATNATFAEYDAARKARKPSGGGGA